MLTDPAIRQRLATFGAAKGVEPLITYLPKSFPVATGLVNRKFMKSLGSELEGIVREEARKAETLFSTWGLEDLERIRKSWLGHGGEVYSMSPADARRYIDDVTSVVEPILSKNPQLNEDYQALLAAAKKYRK